LHIIAVSLDRSQRAGAGKGKKREKGKKKKGMGKIKWEETWAVTP
jgi:hypothetical protein